MFYSLLKVFDNYSSKFNIYLYDTNKVYCYDNIKDKKKEINIEIKNIKSYYDREDDISKILYYNKLKYKIYRYNNKVNLKIFFDSIEENNINYNYYDFYLTDLLKLINIKVLDSSKYLSQINEKLNDINFNSINHHEL